MGCPFAHVGCPNATIRNFALQPTFFKEEGSLLAAVFFNLGGLQFVKGFFKIKPFLNPQSMYKKIIFWLCVSFVVIVLPILRPR